jgi:hypothetical protein
MNVGDASAHGGFYVVRIYLDGSASRSLKTLHRSEYEARRMVRAVNWMRNTILTIFGACHAQHSMES